jgi:hypothetical protein
MTKRRDRKVGVALPRPAPSAEFLASGPTRNATARRRIASAGVAVAKSGKWPTLALVEARDPRIKPATLDRNSDALDPARRLWLDAVAGKLVDAGTFPTIDLLAVAGTVRRTYLAKFEDALIEQRRRWVAAHGAHGTWQDEPMAQAGDAVGIGRKATDDGAAELPRALEVVAHDERPLELAQRQIKRLMAERKSDRAAIATLTAELGEVKEALRRALAMIRKVHAGELSKPSASTRS